MFLFIVAELNIDEALYSKISFGSFTISLSIITRKIPTLPDCFLQETNICHLNRWYFRTLSSNLHIFIYMYIRTYVRECIDYNIQTFVLENRKKQTFSLVRITKIIQSELVFLWCQFALLFFHGMYHVPMFQSSANYFLILIFINLDVTFHWKALSPPLYGLRYDRYSVKH